MKIQNGSRWRNRKTGELVSVHLANTKGVVYMTVGLREHKFLSPVNFINQHEAVTHDSPNPF